MSEIEIDILIPTNRKRLWNMLFQIRAALASPIKTRVTIAMSKPWPELMAHLYPQEMTRIRVIEDAPDGTDGDPFHNAAGYMGAPKIKWCLENLEWADWFYQLGDDDALLPWGLEHFWHARHGVGVVIGQVLSVSRKEHLDFTPYKVGRKVERLRVSCAGALINIPALRTFEKPWYNEFSGYADWEIIARIKSKFPVRVIRNTVHVLSLCEMDQLPADLHPVILEHIKIEE